jgi:hypothetical protein
VCVYVCLYDMQINMRPHVCILYIINMYIYIYIL